MEPDATFCTHCGNRFAEQKPRGAEGTSLLGEQLAALTNDFLSVRQVSPTRFEFMSQVSAQSPAQRVKIKYEAVAQLNPENKQLVFWEKMVESSAGINAGVFGEKTVQKGVEVGKTVHGQLLFGGKYGFEYGRLREVVKTIAGEQGWAFKTVILKPGSGPMAEDQASGKKPLSLRIFLSAVAVLLLLTFGAIAYLYFSDDSTTARSEAKLDKKEKKDKIISQKNRVLEEEGADAGSKRLIETDKNTYRYGEKIKVHYYNAPGGSNDWICIVPAGSPDTDAGVFQYIPKRGQGILVFESPRPGKYEARAFYRYSSGRYKVTARYGFTVKD